MRSVSRLRQMPRITFGVIIGLDTRHLRKGIRMPGRIIIEDEALTRRLQQIARQEQRPVHDVLSSMIEQYQPRQDADNEPVPVTSRQVRLDAYRRARSYWRQIKDDERAALSDEELDEQFWLFDADGVPRLKSDQDRVEIPQNSLRGAGHALREADFRSGRSDIGSRSRDILDTEFADYLLSRLERPVNDDNAPSD